MINKLTLKELAIAYEIAAEIRIKSYEVMEVRELRVYAEELMRQYHQEMMMRNVLYEDVVEEKENCGYNDFHDIFKAIREVRDENTNLVDEIKRLNQELIAKDSF